MPTLETLKAMIGQRIEITLAGDPMYGVTLRWGVLRTVTSERIVLDEYHDSSGGTSRSGRPEKDVPVTLASILRARLASFR